MYLSPDDGQNDMMLFAEATLGKTVDNSKRAGFIKFDRNVLRFQAVHDDRESLNGDTLHFEARDATGLCHVKSFAQNIEPPLTGTARQVDSRHT